MVLGILGILGFLSRLIILKSTKMTISSKAWRVGVSALLFLFIFLWWWLGYPELLAYHEQYQLFLLTGDYLLSAMKSPGGLADYISEFLTQFYYIPWAGALMVAIVLTALQALLGACCAKAGQKAGTVLWIASALPSIYLIRLMSDENLLLSYPVALVIAMAAVCLAQRSKSAPAWIEGILYLVITGLLYWWIGPVALLFALLAPLMRHHGTKGWIWSGAMFVAGLLVIRLMGMWLWPQYPDNQLYLGVNYYRITNAHPDGLIAAWAFVAALCMLARVWTLPIAKPWAVPATACAVIALCCGMLAGAYDQDKMDVFRYDAMVRHGQWQAIISRAESRAPTSDFCRQALNLALGKTEQLGEKMFEFEQNGLGSLIEPYSNNNTSCLVSAEAFYHLGMINSAFRYTFDLQEAIMNDRKSGRFMQRMAECMIIDGRYKVAKKYLGMLEHSLFYRKWAKNAQALLADTALIDLHPVWSEKRRLRFKQDMLYDYRQVHKMLGMLAIESQGQNRLAWEYFNAGMMLTGDLQTMAGMYHYAAEMFGVREIPRHHQEAIAMFWSMGHNSFDGLPYPISASVGHGLMDLAKVYGPNQHTPSAWLPKAQGTYWAYFLMRQPQEQEYASREREG